MSSESLFVECKKCGQTIAKSVHLCPKCGMKQRKLSFFHWAGIIFLIFILFNAINEPKNNDADVFMQNKKNNKILVKADVREQLKFDFSWGKEGFGSIMKADFTIQNNSDYDIKDIKILCVHYAKSGTQIDKNERIVYEIISAGSTKSYPNYNMGLIHEQANRSSCLIEDFSVIM